MSAVDLAFRERGEGAPLVILHGLYGSGRNWDPIARRLAGRRALMVDLRNHGASPWAEPMDYGEMARDVARFMDAQGLESADILGHSMGGKTAMTLALAEPQRVRRLIVADIAPVAYSHSHAPHIAAMKAVDLGAVKRRADAEAQLQATTPDPQLRGFFLHSLAAEGGRYRWRLNLDALERAVDGLTGWETPARARPFAGPAHFIAGALSDYVTPAHEGAIRALFPEAEITHIPEAGHWLHAERPDAVAAAIAEALAP